MVKDDMDTDLPGVKKPGPQYHDGLTGALLQLHLDGREFLVDDLHHALYLLRRDGARPGLLPEKVHHMRCKLVTSLQQDNRFVQDRTHLSTESHKHTRLTETVGKRERKEEGHKEEIFMAAILLCFCMQFLCVTASKFGCGGSI
jgi:hypothetical protein